MVPTTGLGMFCIRNLHCISLSWKNQERLLSISGVGCLLESSPVSFLSWLAHFFIFPYLRRCRLHLLLHLCFVCLGYISSWHFYVCACRRASVYLGAQKCMKGCVCVCVCKRAPPKTSIQMAINSEQCS